MLVLFLYPIITILKGKPMNRIIGIVCGAIGTLFMIYFISSKSANLFGTSINASGLGTYVCVVSLIALSVGSLIYPKPSN